MHFVDSNYTKSLKMLMCICTVMSRRGRSTRSNRQSERLISRQPDYKSPGAFQTLTGRTPAYQSVTGRTPKTMDMEESK